MPRLPLACPVCGAALQPRPRVWACAAGHSFDLAKEGYLNLLPPQHKSRGIDGDSPEMLRARRRFLDAGWFEPLRMAIEDAVAGVLAARDAGSPAVVVEAGCGEGRYIGSVAESLGRSSDALFLGTDLSKEAVRLAAKRHRGAFFFVSDVRRRIYLQDASVSVLLDVFAPRNPGEFARVLEPGGAVLVAIPGPAHLAGLRAALGLLDIEPEKERRVLGRFRDGFRLLERRRIEHPLELSAEAARDLVEMGPNHWHDHRDAIDTPVETQASFVLLTFAR